jgi:hypothetical protein
MYAWNQLGRRVNVSVPFFPSGMMSA